VTSLVFGTLHVSVSDGCEAALQNDGSLSGHLHWSGG
jgi:hypothetical protein